MKLLYLANQRIPTEKAYGMQIVEMCEAFADLGIEVELVAPFRKNSLKEDLFDYYSVKRNFKFIQILSVDWYWPGVLDKLAFWLKSIISARKLARHALSVSPQVFYSREEFPIYFLSLRNGRNIFYEAHKFSKLLKFFSKGFNAKGIKIITITNGLKEEFVKIGFNPDNVLVAPDGVDEVKIKEQEFEPINKEEARKRLDLPLYDKILVYTGSLYEWKGVYVLADVAKILENEALVIIVGGSKNIEEDKFSRYLKEKNINNLKITGYIKDSKIVDLYCSSADTLILPNTSTEKISKIYTSPLKLFSYMTMRRPIVASDLPSIREVLNEDNAVLVKPNDPEELANGIRKILANQSLALRISNKAFADVHDFTWQKRAQNILNFINHEKA